MPELMLPVPVTLSRPHLFTARAATEDSAPKFSAVLILPTDPVALKTCVEAIKGAMNKAIAEMWPNPQQRPGGSSLNVALKNGDEVNQNRTNKLQKPMPELNGRYCLNASSSEAYPPEILAANNAGEFVASTDERLFYPGAEVWAAVNFKAYSHTGNLGVGCYLNGILFHAHGERLDNRADAATMFAAAKPTAAAPAPLAGSAFAGANLAPINTGAEIPFDTPVAPAVTPEDDPFGDLASPF